MSKPSTNWPNAGVVPFSKLVMIASGIIAALVVLFLFLWHATYVLLLAFSGVLIAILLSGAAEWVKKITGLSSRLSLIITVILLVASVGGIGWLAAPPIIGQMEQLAHQVPASLESLKKNVEQYQWGRWLIKSLPDEQQLNVTGPEVISRATGFVSTTIGAFFSLIVVLFVGLYLAVNPTLYTNGLLRLVPLEQRPRAAEILGAIGYTLRWWLIGQFVTMTAVGVMTTIGLWLLGVPLALSLGFLAFLLDFVPNFGPIVAAAPGVLLALADSPTRGLWVGLMYLGVQQIESLLISPLVHQRTVHIPPVLTILSQVLLGFLVGPLGLLLATPLLAVVLVLMKMLYVEETLGDKVDTPDDHIAPEDLPPVPEPKVI
jgi:predicted PurR-regulated permease PerM